MCMGNSHKHGIPKTVRQNGVYMSFRTKEGEVSQFTGRCKSYYLVNKCIQNHLETMGHREDLDQSGLDSSHPSLY